MPALSSDPLIQGQPIPEFSLPDTSGAIWSPGDLRGVRGLVIGFICNHCPYVVAVADRLRTEGQALLDVGFGVAMICSNDAESYPADSFEKMGAFAQHYAFPFPYLHDESQEVAKTFGAVCTPDLFGFDAMLKLQYRGRLDSSGRNAATDETQRELFDAMMQVSRTGIPPEVQHPSIGCSIKWKAAV